MQLTLVVLLVFAISIAVFSVQNATPVTVVVLNRSFDTSLVIVILVSIAAGAVGAGLLGLGRQLRLSLKLRGSNARIQRLEEQVRRLEEAAAQRQDARSNGAGPSGCRTLPR